MNRNLLTLFFLAFSITNLQLLAQSGKMPSSLPIEEHGTCAVSITAPFGMAFSIDSRITYTSPSGSVGHFSGCKVKLARPTILLANVGLVVATNALNDRWNSLDEASKALASVPANPTETMLRRWGNDWGKTLINHYREAKEAPSNQGEVADMLLMTKIGDQFYRERIAVFWNGELFDTVTYGQPLVAITPDLRYTGYCRQFFGTRDDQNRFISATVALSTEELARKEHWGTRRIRAKSTTDLADAIWGLENLSVDIDKRLHGDDAVTAPPFAAAQWSSGDSAWKVEFNPECDADLAPHPN